MKAIMYHYVRPETERPPNYYHLNITDFRRQLDYFEEKFGFVDRDDFLAAVRGERDSVPSGVVLTFDDGLRDHYDVVFPELKKRDLWGIFYVPTGPFETGTALDVHRTHLLLGSVSGSELLTHTREIVDEEMIPHEKREEYKTESYKHQDDSQATKEVKRVLNYFVSDTYQSDVLDELMTRLEIKPIDVSDFYMLPGEMREMHEHGMILGGHTVTHPVLSKLDEQAQREQITKSLDYLNEIVGGRSPRTFCYPYGGEFTFNETTISILTEVGCEWCFAVESADITRTDLSERLQWLPRYDCNEFPHGTASGSIG